jgi:hypothetical protein
VPSSRSAIYHPAHGKELPFLSLPHISHLLALAIAEDYLQDAAGRDETLSRQKTWYKV